MYDVRMTFRDDLIASARAAWITLQWVVVLLVMLAAPYLGAGLRILATGGF